MQFPVMTTDDFNTETEIFCWHCNMPTTEVAYTADDEAFIVLCDKRLREAMTLTERKTPNASIIEFATIARLDRTEVGNFINVMAHVMMQTQKEAREQEQESDNTIPFNPAQWDERVENADKPDDE